MWGLLIVVKNWMNSKFTIYFKHICAWRDSYYTQIMKVLQQLIFRTFFFSQKLIKCIYSGVGYDEIIVWMWPLCISIRAYWTLIENLSSPRETKERYYAMWLSLWLISLQFDDWYAETFVQQLEVQFLLCFIDLKNQLTLLKQTVLETLPTSIPRIPVKL